MTTSSATGTGSRPTRRYVEKASNGRIGYVYVPDTGIGGQNDLVRQFRGQWDKAGLIIDERFNSGGQIPDRFVEMLGQEAPQLLRRARRQGLAVAPIARHDGPHGHAHQRLERLRRRLLPLPLQEGGARSLIGRRTWGGLIGISGAPALIDGGNVTVPTFGIFSKEGQWIVEGYGVDPDIEVIDDPALLTQGKDPQLDGAIREVEASLKRNPPASTRKPAYRTAPASCLFPLCAPRPRGAVMSA